MTVRTKVDESLVAKAKEMRARGMKQDEIAIELGVTQGTISRVLRQGFSEARPRGRRPSKRLSA